MPLAPGRRSTCRRSPARSCAGDARTRPARPSRSRRVPPHARIAGSCSARAYENERIHGLAPAIAFIALRFAVASSGLCPPDRKLIVGTAAGTVRRSTRSVASATCSGVALAAFLLPGSTMLGFSTMPSSLTLWRASASNTAPQHRLADFVAAVDVVRPVDQHLRLDDRHDALLLADRRVAREHFRVRRRCRAAWACDR